MYNALSSLSISHRLRWLPVVLSLSFSVGGCAFFSSDAGLSVAQDIAAAELKKDVAKITTDEEALSARARARSLLRRPLTADAAVQVALLRNHGLQASFNQLGISEAQYVEAILPPAPKLSLTRIVGGGVVEIEREIVLSFLQLATLPIRIPIAERRFRAAQYRAAEAVLKLAAATRRQYYRAVAANQLTMFLQEALGTAESASELATQLGETGALNKLEQAREHAFYVELGAQLAKARVTQRVERERLTRQLGMWGPEVDFKLVASLPPLPRSLQGSAGIEQLAVQKRVDLAIARYELDALARQYGLTTASGYVSAFEIGYADKIERSEGEKTVQRGFAFELRIPIYDFGATAVRGAQERYMRAANRLAHRAVNARSEVREAYLRYRGNYDIARHYERSVLPLRRTIQEEALLHYSGMLIDVSRLIQDARARILSNRASIEAKRDFWIGAADLKAAIIGGGFGGGAEEEKEEAGAQAGGDEDEGGMGALAAPAD